MADPFQPQQKLNSTIVRQQFQVRGVVQGVGFRPFVYRLALEMGLSGLVGNDSGGVTLEVEGDAGTIQIFLERLRRESPPLARIDAITMRELPAQHAAAAGFRIHGSERLGQATTGIAADAATCSDCLREMLDPSDRRYRYPFLNCTNCGPRFTITRQIPYDRPQTSMASFNLCVACQQEYEDPQNRRFHAQPNACAACGPRLTMVDAMGVAIACNDVVTESISRLLAGQILAIKGIGGFHLVVDGCNEQAVARLRQRKHRLQKPLAVMVRDLDAARRLALLDGEEEKLLLSPARPIVLALSRPENGIARSVAPGIPWLGIFLPYAPVHHLLFAGSCLHALVMTSANRSEEPIAIGNDEAVERLASIADAFVLHDREILQRCDDSVAAVVDGAPQLLRRARGFVPLGLALPFDAAPMLAVGGHMKNVFALARGSYVYQSQHLGDLEDPRALDFFVASLDHFLRSFEITPELVAHDLHPGYLSSAWAAEWAQQRGLPTVAVQHHHAHIAAAIAEHQLAGPVIGLALDGTGYGSDQKIWGGEVLLVQMDHFHRFAHLEYLPMPGGAAAVKEPWRMALAALGASGFDLDSPSTLHLAGATREQARVCKRMIERGVNAPLTSSLGRLFDAAGALILGRRVVDYEAQAAIELEGLAIDEPESVAGYPMELLEGNWAALQPMRISAAPLWRELVRDLQAGVAKPLLSARFHAAICDGFTQAALRARLATGVNQVVMSGGCMHNRRLVRLLRGSLEAHGFAVFTQRMVSPGDGGLSYGQIVVAAACQATRNDCTTIGEVSRKSRS